jgi:hypothetical protein
MYVTTAAVMRAISAGLPADRKSPPRFSASQSRRSLSTLIRKQLNAMFDITLVTVIDDAAGKIP